MMIGIMLVADILILTYLSIKTDDGFSDLSPEYISGQIQKTVRENGEVQYSISRQGTERIDSFDGFAFLMDDAGDIIWSYQLPEDVPVHYLSLIHISEPTRPST